MTIGTFDLADAVATRVSAEGPTVQASPQPLYRPLWRS
jgi:hypothetical protein